MRVALLSYRSKPHCGGQGVYVRHLSRELVTPRPRRRGLLRPALPRARRGRPADQGARASTSTASPTRSGCPRLREFRDRIDVEEFLTMCTAGFPEPKTFSSRVARLLARAGRRLRRRPRQPGARLPGCSTSRSSACPLVTTHPPPDHLRPPRSTCRRRPTWRKKLTLRRWYGFLRMQGKVARKRPQDPHARRSPPRATSPATSASTRPGCR